MLKRYSIWDKISPVFCPSGEVFTAQQWKDRYPIAAYDVTIVGSAGVINGGYFGVLIQMRDAYAAQGCDFTDCVTDEDILERIEQFEDEHNAAYDTGESSPEERIAAALEAIELNSMDTVNDDDPDLD